MKSRFFWLALGALLAIILLILDVIGVFSSSYTFKGTHINPPIVAPDFQLVDQHGQDFQLSDQRGSVVLIFFGYTYCPDVCPDTLAQFKRLIAALGEQSSEVRFVFVTVDPDRDTPERVEAYLDAFDPAIIGLVGPLQGLEQVQDDYWVYAEKSAGSSGAGYLVDHTAQVYAIDKNNNLRLTYSFGTPAEELLADIRYLLKERMRE